MLKCNVCEKRNATHQCGCWVFCSKCYKEEMNKKYTCPFCYRKFPFYDGNGEPSVVVERGWCDDCDKEMELDNKNNEQKKTLLSRLKWMCGKK